MSTEDFIIDLFYRIDVVMADVPKHAQASLYPSEIVTLALLFALKGVGPRAFYRWLSNNYRDWFPGLPERTRLFRLFATHRDWTRLFLEAPTVLGIAGSYGMELVHPMREGRSTTQIGKKGLSNHRWIVGVKLCLVLNQWGLVTDWDCDTANVSDQRFHPLIEQFQEQMIVLTDSGFHAKEGDPQNMPEYEGVCPRHLERPHDHRDSAEYVAWCLSDQESHASLMGTPQSALGVCFGRLQHLCAVGRLPHR